MLTSQIRFYLLLALVIGVCWCGCEPAADEDATTPIKIQLSNEPNRLNPMLSNSTSERAINNSLYFPLADIDPISLQWKPFLITEIPDIAWQNGDTVRYDFQIRPEAQWSDGTPITGEDVHFALKLLTIETFNSPTWKLAYIPTILAIDVSQENPKQFSITALGQNYFSKNNILTLYPYPHHLYDPQGIIKDYSYTTLKDTSQYQKLVDNNADIIALGEKMMSAQYSQSQTIEGAGPYQLTHWESGQYIILTQKENWWGNTITDAKYLQAIPQQLVFQIIKDPVVAITKLKANELDLIDLTRAQVQVYEDLRESHADDYKFKLNELPQLYVVRLNHKSLLLQDIEVREALQQIIDRERLIAQQEGGYGTPVNNIIHPKLPMYRATPPVSITPDELLEDLSLAGWEDTNSDGTLDKNINGKRRELSLRLFISGSSLSKNISTMLKNDAKKINIDIDVITKSPKRYRTENIATGDYELNLAVITQPASGELDLSYNWSSDAIGPGGGNTSFYSNPKLDNLIDSMALVEDEERRQYFYEEAQRLFDEDQIAVFLYAPMQRYVYAPNIEPVFTFKRPGYWPNLFTRK